MTKLGSRKLLIFPKVTKVGPIIGHRIDYNGVGALKGQRHIPSKNLPKYPPPGCSNRGAVRKAKEAHLIHKGNTLPHLGKKQT